MIRTRLYCCQCHKKSTSEHKMSSYKKPCRYCGQLVPANANACPFCGKINPLASRCPKCRALTQSNWVTCSSCGLSLRIKCPNCGQDTFFGDYCDKCGGRLVVECGKCHTIQAPISATCIKCKRPLSTIEK